MMSRVNIEMMGLVNIEMWASRLESEYLTILRMDNIWKNI